MTRMKRGTTNHRPLTTRSAFLSAAFARATAGGLRSAVLVVPTLFPSLSFVKIFLPDEGVASTATANPQVRHGESVSPRRPDEERSRHFTMARKSAAPLPRRRADACLLPGV